MAKSRERRKTYQTLHECMEDLLGRKDLMRIHQLGLWSFFASVDQVKQFAALPRDERRAFFDRYAESLADDRDAPSSPDPDYQLFDLPQDATAEQIRQRYRELALAFHPDRSEGDNELMQEINLTYQRLLAKVG
jgi:hypothetical protein